MLRLIRNLTRPELDAAESDSVEPQVEETGGTGAPELDTAEKRFSGAAGRGQAR